MNRPTSTNGQQGSSRQSDVSDLTMLATSCLVVYGSVFMIITGYSFHLAADWSLPPEFPQLVAINTALYFAAAFGLRMGKTWAWVLANFLHVLLSMQGYWGVPFMALGLYSLWTKDMRNYFLTTSKEKEGSKDEDNRN